jgi:hypothetical protein
MSPARRGARRVEHLRAKARLRPEARATSRHHLRSPSQSVRNPTTWFQLGVIRDAGPEITKGLGAFLYAARLTGRQMRCIRLP